MSFEFSCLTSAPYADFAYKTIPNGRSLSTLWKDVFYDGYTPYVFPPSNFHDLNKARITFASDEYLQDLEKRKVNFGYHQEDLTEFYYPTSNFSDPKGKFKHKISKFINSDFKILNSYDKEKVALFYYQWRKQKSDNSYFLKEDERFFFFCLENLEKYKIEQIYIEQNETLVGLAWGRQENEEGWNVLFLKNNHTVHWLNYYLLHELAKIFKDFPYFTFGTDARENSLNEYKVNLHPCETKRYHSIIIP
jgi:hypothetical protein